MSDNPDEIKINPDRFLRRNEDGLEIRDLPDGLGKFRNLSVAYPLDPNHSGSKAFVDGTIRAINADIIVRAASLAARDLSVSIERRDTIDNESLVSGDLVIIKDQSDIRDNGIYIIAEPNINVGQEAAIRVPATDLKVGQIIYVTHGTVNTGCFFELKSTSGFTGIAGAPVYGVDDIEFAKIDLSVIPIGGVGSGIGQPYPEVNTFILLPDPITNGGNTFLVRMETGTIGTRKLRGLYRSNGTVWQYLGDPQLFANEVIFGPTGNISSTLVQDAIEELDLEKANIIHGHDANEVNYDNSNTNITSTNVQNTIDEIQTLSEDNIWQGDINNISEKIFNATAAAKAEALINIVKGQAVYLTGTGKADLAKADATGTTQMVGLAFENKNATFSLRYVLVGMVELTDWTPITGSLNLSIGSTYYLSPTTAGGLTTIAPTAIGKFVVQVGNAISATRLNIEIQQTVLL